jgi:hypothetical protein
MAEMLILLTKVAGWCNPSFLAISISAPICHCDFDLDKTRAFLVGWAGKIGKGHGL